MVFTVLAAVDLNAKCNFELTFPGKPSIAELRSRIDRDLGTEAALRRPGVPFAVSRVQVFDERLQMWVDLVAAVQLEDYCQLYVFQVESPYCRDLPGHIPPPQRPAAPPSPQRSAVAGSDAHYDARGVSPQRQRSLDRDGSPASAAASYPIPPPSAAAQEPAGGHQSPYRTRAEMIERMSVPEQPPATMVDKVRIVYDDLDQSRSRKVTLENWRDAYERLRLSSPEGLLSSDTVDDLFRRKADKNNDSIVSFQEWARFAESYPKLLDCLYYRSRALTHEKARKENLERSQQEQDALEARVQDADEAARDAEAAMIGQQQAVAAAQDAVDVAQEKEQQGKATRDDAHGQSEEARARLRDAAAERDRKREDVRGRDGGLRQAQRAVAASEKKRDAKQGDLERAQRELDRLRQILAQQEQEVRKQEEELAAAEAGVDEAKQGVREKEDEKAAGEGDAQAAQGAVGDAEAELKQRLDAEGDLAKAHRELLRDVTNAQAAQDREKKDLAAKKQKAEAQQRAQQRAQDALDDHRRVVAELTDKDRQLDEQRANEQSKENTIIEGEIRLREQRDMMEEKEMALSQAANDFAQETGRVVSLSPPREPQY